MKRLLPLVAFFATLQASAQQVNPVPDYVFRNQMSVGRNAVTDTAAYFSIGPRYGANKGFMPPIVVDTSAVTGTKRNGLLIFSVQKNKFLYWDSVRVQWSDMAGSSGSYITGSGITGYIPQFSASTTLDTSALYSLGSRLGIGTSTFAYNSTNTANIELNNTAGGILGFKRNDSARGYLWHTGDNMELANTAAGSIFFNTNSATRGSISSAGVWRLHNLAGTGDRVVQASSNGTLSATTSVTGLVDTLTISTRAWRQKGLDSLAALEVSGSGTTNYVPKFTAARTLGNSSIFNHANGNVGVNTTVDAGLNLDVAGSFRATKNSIINNINIGLGNNDTITNHAFGFQALNSNTTGRRNGAFGYSALTTNTSGIFNNAFGYNSLLANTSGNNNNAFGYAALTSNTTGTGNTGYGYQVLYSNTTGSENIAIGSNALYYVTTGGSNVAIGDRSMAFQSATSAMTGSFNVGIGRLTLGSLKTGQQNTAIGDAAMYLFANGSTNTAIGSNALVNNTSGSSNVALGFSAGAYETGSNAFYVNNKDQSNTANDKSFSLLYGVFASSAGSLTNQKLRVNGKLEVATVDSTATGINVLYVDTDGTIKKARGPLNIQTGDPTGGTSKPWKLGEVATVSPTSPNRTIRVEIDGTVYYIHAKTTND